MTNKMPSTHPEAALKNLMCGSCQWFSAGYKGNTCQITRGVGINTVACIEYLPTMQDPYNVYSKDKYILGLRESLKSSLSESIHKKWREEISGYNIDPSSINFAAGQHNEVESLKVMLKTVIEYRNRITEICSTLILEEGTLDEVEEKAYIWLVSKYEEVRDLKNEKQRQMVISRAMPEYVTIKHEIYRTSKLAKFIDDKLDKNDKTLMKLIDVAKSTYFNPNKI